MKLLYKCACMDDYAEIEVLERKEHQTVGAWSEDHVQPAVAEHHGLTRPRCVAEVMDAHIKIHVHEASPGIGYSPKFHS